jgi:DNA-binding NarL/FixJ family response regulator
MTGPQPHDHRGDGVRPLRVATIDDDASVRRLLRLTFEVHGGAVVVAEADGSARSVTDVCAAHPEVILVDLDLGAVEGIDLIDELRSRCPEAMLVLLTARDGRDRRRRAAAAGAFAAYSKDQVTVSFPVRVLEDHARFTGGPLVDAC